MYAARKLYVKRWKHQSPEERYTVQIARGGKSVPGIKSDQIARIDEEVMYWRKANHIHAWFVENVQDGEDDCKTYCVDWDKLRELLSICQKVIKVSKLVDGTINAGTEYTKEHPDGLTLREPGKVIEDATVAKQLLPTCEGFFFGGTEYDDYYLDCVKETQAWLQRMLADHKNGVPGNIYYSSSW